MCAVSMIGDHYRDKWNDRPWNPFQQLPQMPVSPLPYQQLLNPQITRQEFDDLKKEVEEMKLLLARAKKYDEDNGEPACEMEEKVEVLRRVAKIVGVDLSDIFGK